MKNKIKEWLGITKLESTIGKFEPKKKSQSIWDMWMLDPWGWNTDTNTLVGRCESIDREYKKLKKDFEELDKKFDALERYLQIEFYKEDKETQVYDWADKKHAEGFRKTTKTYEQMKKEKENPEEDCEDDD